jgi:hypothetical protein
MHHAGDTVVTRWTGSGNHSGDLVGIPATNKRVAVDGIWMHRIAQGKIVESWNAWDMLGLLQQIGIVPKMDAAKRVISLPLVGRVGVGVVPNCTLGATPHDPTLTPPSKGEGNTEGGINGS